MNISERDINRLRNLVDSIDNFADGSEECQYMDTGDALELFGTIRIILQEVISNG